MLVQLSIHQDIVALELLVTHKLASQQHTQGYSRLLALKLIHMLTTIPLVLPLALVAATSSLSVLTINLSCLLLFSLSIRSDQIYIFVVHLISLG